MLKRSLLPLLARFAGLRLALLFAMPVWAATGDPVAIDSAERLAAEQVAGQGGGTTAQALAQACAAAAAEAAQAPQPCIELIDLAGRQSLPADLVAGAYGNRAVWMAKQATDAEQLEQALALSDQALSLAPTQIALQINHATVLLASGRLEDALATYQGLLNQQLSSYEHVVRFNYAIALRASGAVAQSDIELQLAREAEQAALRRTTPPLHSGAGLEPRLR